MYYTNVDIYLYLSSTLEHRILFKEYRPIFFVARMIIKVVIIISGTFLVVMIMKTSLTAGQMVYAQIGVITYVNKFLPPLTPLGLELKGFLFQGS